MLWIATFKFLYGHAFLSLLVELGILCLNVSRASRGFSEVALPPPTFPLVTFDDFGFSASSATFLPLPLFVKSHILVGEWYLTGVRSASLWWLTAWSIFLCALWLCLLLELCDIPFTYVPL